MEIIRDASGEDVTKDEFCRCSCHRIDGLSHRECPACYFSDGNPELNRRLSAHCAKYEEE